MNESRYRYNAQRRCIVLFHVSLLVKRTDLVSQIHVKLDAIPLRKLIFFPTSERCQYRNETDHIALHIAYTHESLHSDSSSVHESYRDRDQQLQRHPKTPFEKTLRNPATGNIPRIPVIRCVKRSMSTLHLTLPPCPKQTTSRLLLALFPLLDKGCSTFRHQDVYAVDWLETCS